MVQKFDEWFRGFVLTWTNQSVKRYVLHALTEELRFSDFPRLAAGNALRVTKLEE